jgi:hypothetical protein
MQPTPDPYVDQIVENLIGVSSERQYDAWQTAVDLLHTQPERIVPGLCDVVDHVLDAGLDTSIANAIVFVVCSNTEQQPELVPLDTLHRWAAAADRFEPHGLGSVLTMLSRVRPDQVVSRYHALALETSFDAGIGSSELWANVGTAYPEVVLEIAEMWFKQMGWDTEFGSSLLRVFEDLARVRPDQIEAMIRIVEDAQTSEVPVEPGLIRLRQHNFASPGDVIATLDAARGR